MKTLDLTLHEFISTALRDLYDLPTVDFKVERPANESFGDYASNVALVLSKSLKQSPLIIANDLCYKLQVIINESSLSDVVRKTEAVAPGFINFTISDNWLIKLLDTSNEPNSGYRPEHKLKKERIALEHSNVNPNKAAHVGHLRNACIGQFLERSYEYLGYDVEVQYYANNIGVQVATSNMGLTKMSHISPDDYKKFDHYAWDVYSNMENQISQSPQLQEERQNLLKKLEDPTSNEFKVQKELADRILTEQLKTFSNLGIDYDVIIYESDIVNLHMWEKAFTLLQNNSNVYKSEEGPSKGCWLVRMDEEETPLKQPTSELVDEVEKDKIIVRSNGIPTYTGKDIAYHMWKYGLLGIDFNYIKWNPGTQEKELWTTSSESHKENTISFSGVSKVFDVIGVEQTYAMEAVKKSLKYLGYEKEALNMKHVNYGFVYVSRATAKQLGMDVSDEKKFYEMSGRKGWGVKIDDFIDLVDAKLAENYGNFEYRKQVRNAAIKIQMLKTNTFQDLVFDLDEALDTKGYSGPYMQYAYVRTRSLASKATELNIKANNEISSYTLTQSELSLLKWCVRYHETVVKAVDDLAPNILSDYLFELSKRYNTFYNSENIIKEADPHAQGFRLHLNEVVGSTIKEGLYLLGIDTPEKM